MPECLPNAECYRVTMNEKMLLVIDLEATCDKFDKLPLHEMEIIEIGAVWATTDGHIVDTFDSFVRPTVHTQLTPFCRQLTGISQSDVDEAPLLAQIIGPFSAFVNRQNAEMKVWSSWGDYDRKQWLQDCARQHIHDPLAGFQHINLKKRFAHSRNIKQVGMAKALEIVGLTLEGQHHRALPDAKNIARLLCWMD